MQLVKVFCQQENKVIAEMPLPGSNQKVNALWVWREYRPVAQEYTLPSKRPKDGEYLLCPNCYGKVELVSTDVEQVSTERSMKDSPRVPPVSRAAVRAKIVSDMSGAFNEHVSSSDTGGTKGRPFILGALRVRK